MPTTTTATSAERCALCNCLLTRRPGTYATPTVEGRSHATAHHYVAERFYGRSANRRGTQREPMFAECPWDVEGQSAVFCYECHELLLHNPVLLPEDVAAFATLVRDHGLDEDQKPQTAELIAGRVRLFHDVIRAGLAALAQEGQSVERETSRLPTPLGAS